MRSCCVPGCNIRTPLHSVPYTKKLRWEQWLKLCPFLSKYTFPQLEYVKICRNHFIPEHIDFEKGRLRKYSFPLLNLPDIQTNKTVNKGSKVLEIYPIDIESNESINFKVVPTGPEVQTENTFESPTEGSKETPQLQYLTSLKAEDANGLPVDHSMYCLPLRAVKQPTCLHSPLMLSPNEECYVKAEPIAAKCTFIKTMSIFGAAPRDTVSVATQTDTVTKHVPEPIAAKCTFIRTMLTLGAAPSDTVSVATQTDAVTEHLPSQQLPDIMSAQNEHSLIKDLKMKTAELLYDHVCTESSQTKINTPVNSSTEFKNTATFSIQHLSLKPTASILQPSQRAQDQVQTLESLVAELMESVNAEEIAESQPSPTNTPAFQLTPTSDTAPCPPTKSPSRKHPALTSDTEIRVSTGKENSTPNEQMLQMRNKMLKNKLRSANKKCKNLRLKLDRILGIAKPFLKAYPYLTQEMKSLIDMQVRLAGVQSRAARYHEDEKLFAFRLYQTSPDCYRFLQQYLKLPAKNTMQAIIKNVGSNLMDGILFLD